MVRFHPGVPDPATNGLFAAMMQYRMNPNPSRELTGLGAKMQFKELGTEDRVLENLTAIGYENPTEIQEKSIPVILAKQDAVIESHTGSGKTAAFGIPLVQSVSIDVPAVQYLILVPARELALQVFRELERLAAGLGVNVVPIYGGASFSTQVDGLKKGAHIVVGTPGRVLDHLKRRTMSFSVVRGLVLDEADKMLSMGFLPEMRLIFKHLPRRHQTIMSSATFPPSIEHLIHSLMVDPARVQLESSARAPVEIDHCYCMTTQSEKDQVLLRFIEKEEPELSMVFCNTKIEVKSVSHFLNGAGVKSVFLSSDLSQSQRERNLTRFRLGLVQVMVCTDLAGRGIDVPNLSHVFVYSTSDDIESYVHRTGRTGRAGKAGRAISLVSGNDVASFNLALKSHGIKAEEVAIPTDEEIIAARVESEIRVLKDIDYARDVDVHDDFIRLAESLSADQARTLLPFLLEKFLRHEYVQEPEPPIVPKSVESAPRDHGGKSGRKPRSSGGRSRQATLVVALGHKDGLSADDVKDAIKRAARLKHDDIENVDLGEYESKLMVPENAVRFVMRANGKFFRNQEIYIKDLSGKGSSPPRRTRRHS